MALIMEAKREPVLRYYDTLRNYVGENRVFKAGDILYISTKGDGVYDTILTADGRSTFKQLMNISEEDDGYEYVKVKKDS